MLPLGEARRALHVYGEILAMPMAYCPKCNELRTIRKAPVQFPGERENWRMAEHEDANGKRCEGVGKRV